MDIGASGASTEHKHLWPGRDEAKPIWKKLDDPAARAYLYFPIDAGWRIKELVATVKYLSPIHDQKTFSEQAADDWAKLQPLMDGAGNLAAKLGPVPGVGTIAAGAAPILSTLAKLKIGSVPQGVDGFDWSVAKVTFNSQKLHGVMQGVMWTLPEKMFETLGGRLTGSVAVSFIPTRRQSSGAAEAWTPQSAPLLGHVVVYADGQHRWVPGSSAFVELRLSPRTASASHPG